MRNLRRGMDQINSDVSDVKLIRRCYWSFSCSDKLVRRHGNKTFNGLKGILQTTEESM